MIIAAIWKLRRSMIEKIGGNNESPKYPFREGDPITTLKDLMAEHGLNQSDLPEIGSQGVVSEILSGKR